MSRYIFVAFIILSLVSCGGDSQQYITDNPSSVSSPESSSGSSIQKDSSPETSSGSKRGITAKYVPGEVLVKFKAGTAASITHGIHKALGATKIEEVKHIRVQHIRLPHNMNVEEAVQYYRSNPDVEYAEPNYIVEKAATVPDDTYFNNLWGLNNIGQTGGTTDADIDAPEAWDITKGSSNIIIAVVDSGVAYNHPDFTGNKWINTSEQSGSPGIDDDGNGYVDDIYGWDFIDNDGYPEDYNSHGTHVAGTIAAKGNNGIGIAGVMWSAKIMPIRFLGVSGVGSIANAVDAIIYAADNGARIVNASWGGYGYSSALYDAIDYARTKDVLFVAAAGNEKNDNDIHPFYPASYDLPNIISVAATDNRDVLADFSNYGANSVHLAAPGVSIYSSIPTFSYGAAVTEYNRNFDSDTIGNLPSGWSSGGINNTWAVTDLAANSAPNSLTDSPSGDYQSNTNSWAGCMTPIISAKNNRYTLYFKWKGILQSYFDYLNINYSPDRVFWDWIDYRTGGTGGNFISDYTYEITAAADLLDSFYFGFGLESDYAGNYDGAYIDDIALTRQTVNISGYTYDSYEWSGTSMAVAHVSGVAGLILSINPSLSYAEVKDIILNNVDLKPSLSGVTLTGGRLNAFAAVSSIVPAAPSSLIATVISGSQINLSWVDNSAGETGFKIERKTGIDGTFSQIATVGANVTTYSDTGLSPSTTYYYRIRAYNTAGDSSYSNEASATTHASPSGSGGGGGGCSVGKVHNYQTAVADTIVLIMPLIVILILRRFLNAS